MDPTDHLNVFISGREGFHWQENGEDRFRLVSGPWKAGLWEHDIVVVRPLPRSKALSDEATAILYITGGEVNAPDLQEAQAIANRSRLAVAMLFHIPNQPIFDLWEDDLIAHTFEQFLDSGDATWPLLYPMVRAVVRTMDMLGASGFSRFVVTGASKRGWTTWLAAATGDRRIVGIAPMVIDNLNFPMQMAHQLESWGGYSEQIEDYTSRDLQDSMDTDRGAELTVMMDPIHYIDRIKCPILIVNGSNDRYWTVDALSLYWDRLPSSKRCLIVPNVGHLLGGKVRMIETLSAFAAASAHDILLPEVRADLVCSKDMIGAKVFGADEACELWAAYSASLDFRDSEWLPVVNAAGSEPPKRTRDDCGSTGDFRILASSRGDFGDAARQNVALLAEFRLTGPTGKFSLSSPIEVFTSDGP